MITLGLLLLASLPSHGTETKTFLISSYESYFRDEGPRRVCWNSQKIDGISKKYPRRELCYGSNLGQTSLSYESVHLVFSPDPISEGHLEIQNDLIEPVAFSSDRRYLILNLRIVDSTAPITSDGEKVIRQEALIIKIDSIINQIDALAEAHPDFDPKIYSTPWGSKTYVWKASDIKKINGESKIIKTLVPDGHSISDYSERTNSMVISEPGYSNGEYKFIDGWRSGGSYTPIPQYIATPYTHNIEKLFSYWSSYTQERWKEAL